MFTTDRPLWVYANVMYPLDEPVTGRDFDVEIGQEIPTVFYKAVAEVLTYVYQLKNKRI